MKRVVEDLQAKMQIRSSSHNMPRINFYPNKVIDDLRKKHSGIFVRVILSRCCHFKLVIGGSCFRCSIYRK